MLLVTEFSSFIAFSFLIFGFLFSLFLISFSFASFFTDLGFEESLFFGFSAFFMFSPSFLGFDLLTFFSDLGFDFDFSEAGFSSMMKYLKI